jgi:hypothetical protein
MAARSSFQISARANRAFGQIAVRYTREMGRRVWLALLFVTVAATMVAAQRGAKVSATVECAANVGNGLKSRRTFCDVLIATTPAASINVTIPPHTGEATLRFDLHNRFTLPAVAVAGALTYARHEAVVAVIRPNGAVIRRAAVAREFRTVADLFDQIGGGSRTGGAKAIAPGPAEPIVVTVPASLASVGIVGVSLEVKTWASEETFDTPGRPVALISNVRVQYRPR